MNWTVTVWNKLSDKTPVATWNIENRSEHQAEREAMADVTRDYPDADCWTLMPDEKNNTSQP